MAKKQKKRLRTWVKVVLVSIPVIAGIVCLIVFGFKLKYVSYKSDLNEFTAEEVKAYLDYDGRGNAFTLWFRDKIGQEPDMDLFEDYDVNLKGFDKVEIVAHEKQFKGYIKNDSQLYFFDEDGKMLKNTSDKIKGIPKVVGLNVTNANLYKKVGVTNKKQFNAVLQVAMV